MEFFSSSFHPKIFIIPTRQTAKSIDTKWNQNSQKNSSDFCQLDSLMCIGGGNYCVLWNKQNS